MCAVQDVHSFTNTRIQIITKTCFCSQLPIRKNSKGIWNSNHFQILPPADCLHCQSQLVICFFKVSWFFIFPKLADFLLFQNLADVFLKITMIMKYSRNWCVCQEILFTLKTIYIHLIGSKYYIITQVHITNKFYVCKELTECWLVSNSCITMSFWSFVIHVLLGNDSAYKWEATGFAVQGRRKVWKLWGGDK